MKTEDKAKFEKSWYGHIGQLEYLQDSENFHKVEAIINDLCQIIDAKAHKDFPEPLELTK